jgi:hypothetical protein
MQVGKNFLGEGVLGVWWLGVRTGRGDTTIVVGVVDGTTVSMVTRWGGCRCLSGSMR